VSVCWHGALWSCSGYIKGSIWRGEITYALFLVQSRTLLLPAACCLLPSRNPERRHRRTKTAARRHSGVTLDSGPVTCAHFNLEGARRSTATMDGRTYANVVSSATTKTGLDHCCSLMTETWKINQIQIPAPLPPRDFTKTVSRAIVTVDVQDIAPDALRHHPYDRESISSTPAFQKKPWGICVNTSTEQVSSTIKFFLCKCHNKL